jgi:ribosomal protein S18 acetylase RimI-like enzyme
VPGACALFWPPRSVADGDAPAREDRLLAHALARVRADGAKLAQSLLTVEETRLAASLKRNGFRHITRLWYFATDPSVSVTYPPIPERLEYRTYDLAQPTAFHQTLLRTYEGTCDCPEINGVRAVEEVIAGHRAQGRFDPGRWWLALEDGRSVGVLLMTEMADSGHWDVSYLGIAPEARRRGLGRAVMRKGLLEAKAGGARRVTLSVDARNAPALQLYRSLGFAAFDCREVFLAIWR